MTDAELKALIGQPVQVWSIGDHIYVQGYLREWPSDYPQPHYQVMAWNTADRYASAVFALDDIDPNRPVRQNQIGDTIIHLRAKVEGIEEDES